MMTEGKTSLENMRFGRCSILCGNNRVVAVRSKVCSFMVDVLI